MHLKRLSENVRKCSIIIIIIIITIVIIIIITIIMMIIIVAVVKITHSRTKLLEYIQETKLQPIRLTFDT